VLSRLTLCAQPTHAVSKVIRQKDAVFFCSQNIAEFWNVATRPADLNGLGLSREEVLQEVSSIERLLTFLPDIPAIYPAWKEIVADNKVQGQPESPEPTLSISYRISGKFTFLPVATAASAVWKEILPRA
jgi:hypothetical protein